jgi:hypothetical protein
MHGGRSTGPRTPEGLARSQRARWKRGRYSAAFLRGYRQEKLEAKLFTMAAQARHAALMGLLQRWMRESQRDRRNARRRQRRRAARRK